IHCFPYLLPRAAHLRENRRNPKAGAPGMTRQPAGPLSGVTVLDLCSYLAGPYGCTLLADLGADVIKIESPQGDMLRQFPSSLPGQARFFLGTNRGKRAVVLDLKQPEGLAVLHRMIETADVLDYFTSALLAYGVAAALFRRERSGEGQYLSLSLLRSALTIQAGRFVWAESEGRDVARDSGTGGLTGIHPTKDGALYISVHS